MNESEGQLHKKLYSLFGDSLYDANTMSSIDSSNLRSTFTILNAELFDNKLQPLDPLVLSTSQIQELFDKYKHNDNPNNMYALYMPIPNWHEMELNNMKTILDNQFLIVNSTTCKYASTSFIVNALCHEMIHYYDTMFGDVLALVLDSYRSNKMFNEHLTHIFEEKSKEANSMSLTIFPDASGIPLDKLSNLSAMRLARKKPINEIESLEELEDEVIGNARMKNFKPHHVATDLGDGNFVVSF